ncbi:hypothetical protein JM654_04130 [Microbacterium oxydans]|nr:hypothetical protein [Microbacterium oxydans]
MVNSVVGGAIEDMANAVIEGVGKVIASFGTMWVNIGTPVLTGGDGGASAGADAGFSAPVLQVLGYITWIGYAVAIIAIIALASITTVKVRRGEGMLAVGRLGIILAAVILIGGASGSSRGFSPSGPVGAGGAVAFLQGSLWWIMLAVAVGATIVGAIRMAVTMRAEPGKDVFFGLLRLIVVAGAGVGIVALLVTAADAFSVWIIDRSTDCNLSAGDSTCFGRNISNLLVLTTTGTAGAPGLGALLVIILGVIAIIVAVVQIILMLARGGMLVVLTGILPLSAAAAMSGESGKGWFNKNVAWLVAFILYKPAAAIIYAAAFQLAGTDVFQGRRHWPYFGHHGPHDDVARAGRAAGAHAFRHSDGRRYGGRRGGRHDRRGRCRCRPEWCSAGRAARWRRGRRLDCLSVDGRRDQLDGHRRLPQGQAGAAAAESGRCCCGWRWSRRGWWSRGRRRWCCRRGWWSRRRRVCRRRRGAVGCCCWRSGRRGETGGRRSEGRCRETRRSRQQGRGPSGNR